MGKNFKAALAKVETGKQFNLEEAFNTVKECSFAKFDETVEVAFRLGIDTKKSDQQVRGAVVLPHGTGKTKVVAVIAKGEKANAAQDAGADFVGDLDLLEKMEKGWLEFDVLIATPDMMGQVGKLGRVLGPKGLMPNPKTGTVTFEVAKAVEDVKAGKIEYRADKAGVVHAGIGKVSFDQVKLTENFNALSEALYRAKPASSKGVYIKSVAVSSTMGPGVRVDTSAVSK